jgi:hypothetical protein
MTERTQQAGDAEFAVCHVCGRRFETQKDLDMHLMSDHEGELLAGDQPQPDR